MLMHTDPLVRSDLVTYHASVVALLLCTCSRLLLPVLWKFRDALPRNLVAIVQGKLFLFQNRSVVLFIISFENCLMSALVVLSLLFHLGVGSEFLRLIRRYGSCLFTQAYISRLGLVWSTDWNETNVVWTEIGSTCWKCAGHKSTLI